MREKWLVALAAVLSGSLVCVSALVRTELRAQAATPAAQESASGVQVGSDDIGGVVTSRNGAEAGVWVIAETTDLPTKFRKIVVTDDKGRYLIPELPKANYKVWVRGYGLVDSQPMKATPGSTVALTAVVAPTPKVAAQAYPADYCYSLMQIPSQSDFPMTIPNYAGDDDSQGGAAKAATLNQAEWMYNLKRGCHACHQIGTKATREIPAALGHFDSGVQAWQRRVMSGQEGQTMLTDVRKLGYDRAMHMFADWTDRIAAGEVPSPPPRPQGIERNVVISLWDFDTPKAFLHDLISTDKRNPTQNSYGPVFATEWSGGTLSQLIPFTTPKSRSRFRHRRALSILGKPIQRRCCNPRHTGVRRPYLRT